MSSNKTGQLKMQVSFLASQKSLFSNEVSLQKFYHEYHTAVLYAQENTNDPLPVFKTIDEWNPQKWMYMQGYVSITYQVMMSPTLHLLTGTSYSLTWT